MKDFNKTADIVSQAEGSKQLSQVVVLHIPHASRRVPAEDRQAIRLDDDALDRELLRMTDAYTDELFSLTPVEAGRVTFPVSRLICDIERFPSNEDEPMAARGMGVIYTRTSMGAVLRVVPEAVERQSLLDRAFHTPLPVRDAMAIPFHPSVLPTVRPPVGGELHDLGTGEMRGAGTPTPRWPGRGRWCPALTRDPAKM